MLRVYVHGARKFNLKVLQLLHITRWGKNKNGTKFDIMVGRTRLTFHIYKDLIHIQVYSSGCSSIGLLDGYEDESCMTHLSKRKLVAQDFQFNFACLRSIESVKHHSQAINNTMQTHLVVQKFNTFTAPTKKTNISERQNLKKFKN